MYTIHCRCNGRRTARRSDCSEPRFVIVFLLLFCCCDLPINRCFRRSASASRSVPSCARSTERSWCRRRYGGVYRSDYGSSCRSDYGSPSRSDYGNLLIAGAQNDREHARVRRDDGGGAGRGGTVTLADDRRLIFFLNTKIKALVDRWSTTRRTTSSRRTTGRTWRPRCWSPCRPTPEW